MRLSRSPLPITLLMVTSVCTILAGCSNGKSSTTGGGGGSLGTYSITAWGDSLTQGDEDLSGITYPNQLAKLTGQTVTNYGIGGETSSEIAVRMNAYAGKPEQTFAAGFTFPSSGTVNVTFPTGFAPVNTQYGKDYPNGVPIAFTVAGQSYTGNVVETGTMYVLTPATYPSAAVTVPAGTAWTAVLPSGTDSGCVILWAGTNNFTDGTQVQADLAAMVAAAQTSTSCYLVMSVPNDDNPVEWKGTADYSAIMALNSALSATYSQGNHYLDVRSALVALYNPANPADVLDYGNDVWPYSLRAGDVSGTLTAPVGSAMTCDLSADPAFAAGQIISANAEMIQIAGGTNGDYTCVRGYAGTTAATYASGTTYAAVDPLHLGQNEQSWENPKYTNGYDAVAALVDAWLAANGPK
jgi:hypothetical protein